MVGVGEGLQLGVLAVQRAGVLGQVVGADGEEVALLGQVVCDQDGGGGLDHGAHFHVAHLLALGGQLHPALVQDVLGVVELPQAGDHGEHDAQVAVGRSPQQGPQLGLEEVLAGQADADGAVAQGGVLLVVQLHIIDGLVRADVAGADDDLLGGQGLHHLLVGLELVLLGGVVLAVQVDELGAEQAHAAGVVLLDRAHVPDAADVGVDVDGGAVQGGVGLALQLLQQGLFLLILLLALLQGLEQVGGGVHIDAGVVAVDDRHLAVPVVADLLALDQGGDVHAAGQDGGVAVGAALPGDEAQQQALVQPDRLGGGQVLGHQDGGLGALHAVHIGALQDVQHGLSDVHHVGAAGLEVGVVHGGKDGGLVGAGGLDRILGAHLLLGDDLPDGVHKVVVLQHHGVDVEHLGDVLAGLGQRLLIEVGLLLDGFLLRVLKPEQLCAGVGHRLGGNGGIFLFIDLQLADGNAVQYAFTGAYLHISRPFSAAPCCPGRALAALLQKSPRRSPRGLRGTYFSEVLRHELLDGFGGGVLVVTLNLDGHGIALLDAHAHEGHQFAHIAALAVLLDGGGAGVALDDLDEQAGGTGMDAAGILNGILEFLHRSFLLIFA